MINILGMICKYYEINDFRSKINRSLPTYGEIIKNGNFNDYSGLSTLNF